MTKYTVIRSAVVL